MHNELKHKDMTLKSIIFLVVWGLGVIVALLGNKNLREYQHYHNSKLYLVSGIILTITMSWALVVLMIINCEYELPKTKRK